MKWFGAVSLLCFAINSAATPSKRDYDAHDYYAVHLRPGVRPEDVSDHLGLHYDGPLGQLQDHYVFRSQSPNAEADHIQTAIDHLKRRRRRRDVGAEQPHVLDHVLLSKKQDLQRRFPLVKRNWTPEGRQANDANDADWAIEEGLQIAKSLSIEDPIFQEQWHLHNTVQVGHDINVTGVWQQGITGKNSTVCIVDDGLDLDSDDLRVNYFAAGSWDYNDPGPDPKPRLSDDRHGTRCAGEVAAVRNDVCGVGVAYDGKVSGVRILSKVISDVDEAEAMNYEFQQNDIYSCSWGPPDDGRSMEAPGILIKRAMLSGVQNGRGGLGSIYVFAIGNGAANDDNCNFDGYTNSIYSVSVGGIDRKGLHPYYSEACSAQLVVTYSSGSGDAIHTTDVGKASCYNNHGGTSAAGPLVAGIYALMLEANPNLTWRDIQWLTVLTAVKVEEESDWQMNVAVGKEFSHQFGYGKADAYALVDAATTWTNVKPQAWYFSPWLHVKHSIPQGEQGLASSFDVTQEMLDKANLERLEHVTVTMNVEHTRRGDLSVELHSPSGIVSHIATHRRNDAANSGYVDWTFMSVAHFGESGVGRWNVIVKDTNVNEHTGTFTDWRLKLYGESIDPDAQELLPLPTEHDDDNHDEEVQTETASVKTTSVSVPTETGPPAGNPTDHIDRPTKIGAEPSTTSFASAAPTPEPQSSEESTSTAADMPAEASPPAFKPPPEEPVPDHSDDNIDLPDFADENDSSESGHFLPHPFPTFGVSKRTQIWIYGAFVLILLFLSALGAWMYYMRRKRRWMNRDAYEFEMVDNDDGNDDADATAANGRPRKKRAAELYDAFAEHSDLDDEDNDAREHEPFDLGADSEDEADVNDPLAAAKHQRYRDDGPKELGLHVD